MPLYLEGDRVVYYRERAQTVGEIVEIYTDPDNEDDIPTYDIINQNGNTHIEISEEDILEHAQEELPPQNEPPRREIPDILWGPVFEQEAAIAVDPRPILELTPDNVNTLETDDYSPSDASTRLLAVTLGNGIRVVAKRRVGGHYRFMEEGGRMWYNSIDNPEVTNFNTTIDVAGVRWGNADDYVAYQMRTGAGVINLKLKKKLKRKYPMPELKDKEHYDNSEYIA